MSQARLRSRCSFSSFSSSSSSVSFLNALQLRLSGASSGSSGYRFASVCRRVGLHSAFLQAHQRSSLRFCTLLCARRFSGGGARRAPTFVEVSEACSILGVEPDCDQRQLKTIYRDLVRKHHPDAGGEEAAMSRITVAYDRLRGMSKLEKEQYKLQKETYRGGSYYAPGRSSSSSSSGHRYQTSSGYAAHNARTTHDARGFYDSPNGDFFRQGSMRSHSYYNYQQRNQSYAENSFSSSNPFAFRTQIRRAWSMPFSSLLLRGLVMYLGLSIFLLLAYRQYRDWVHDDGWKMSESLARYEQMSEMHRLRQEMNERVRAAREAADAQNFGVRTFVRLPDDDDDYNAASLSRSQELRALEYARRRQMELDEEVKGWPRFGEDKGRLVRRAQDPPGVVFFEPRKEDLRIRQVRNMQVGREWSERKRTTITVDDKEPSAKGQTSVTSATNTGKGVSTTASTTTSGSASTSTESGDAAPDEVEAVSRMKNVMSVILGGEQKTVRNR
ncbi:chaperone protein DNAJ [Trypanosoma rangeli]|uniref:Chaperone protein DNAJ n=1 Tax=Trypanosoma rangeli TaxID=5698 RepID=A0A3R7NAN2_TRYRA|nr:chaperone protein DNAJ [Trypanosoma rangeli]RNE99622.1 chaperone protein DNAJ [Trypanosoma rangeli]|eukprot:RNE99622.1 chaperone protein DNAJ [Trypanosoma rangeli]